MRREASADPEAPATEPVAVGATAEAGAGAQVGADDGGAEVVGLRGDDGAVGTLGHRVDESGQARVVAEPEEGGLGAEAARVVELAYGEWLRRAHRRVDARGHLRRALATFQDNHVDHLADRATQELRASGETARKRDVSTLVQLTPMELKIAELVATGLSNKDIADSLVISKRTAETHVENILTKLGFNNRNQIAAWVLEQTGAGS